jgi:hypothetical protein
VDAWAKVKANARQSDSIFFVTIVRLDLEAFDREDREGETENAENCIPAFEQYFLAALLSWDFRYGDFGFPFPGRPAGFS